MRKRIKGLDQTGLLSSSPSAHPHSAHNHSPSAFAGRIGESGPLGSARRIRERRQPPRVTLQHNKELLDQHELELNFQECAPSLLSLILRQELTSEERYQNNPATAVPARLTLTRWILQLSVQLRLSGLTALCRAEDADQRIENEGDSGLSVGD